MQNKFFEFVSELQAHINEFNEAERQELLVDIMDCYYHQDMFSEYKKAFDIIIGTKLNLNFNIDHWAPSFLCLVTLRAPHQNIFDYFVKKGAEINFIADTSTFDKSINDKGDILPRYLTCLDFVEFSFYDFFLAYSYHIPKKKIKGQWMEYNDDESITITKSEYLYLHEQAEYLSDLISTDKLKDYIVDCGGKARDDV